MVGFPPSFLEVKQSTGPLKTVFNLRHKDISAGSKMGFNDEAQNVCHCISYISLELILHCFKY